jgi:hypothetical protein
MKKKSILQEAEATVKGPRQDSYGHPNDTYTIAAGLVNARFTHKLKEPLTALDMLEVMMFVKHSRNRFGFHRDSWLDMAGFVACAEMVEQEIKRLKK